MPPSDPDRILLIKAKGGLGNRMLSAVTGLVLADLTERRPVIDWRDGSYAPLGENAYPLLFDTPSTRRAEEFDGLEEPVSPAIWQGSLGLTPEAMVGRHAPDKHTSATVYRRFCTDLAVPGPPERVAVFWSYLPKFGRLRPLLRRDPRFAGRPVEAIMADYLARWFVPNARVRQDVAAGLADLPRPLIGVHIRYTDLKVPLAPIKAALRRRLAERPGAGVFLATDNAAVQTEMAAEFPGLSHTQKYLAPDGARLHWPASTFEKTREAENALIDMGMLAGCDHMIYSRQSTFSVTAACLGAIPPNRQDDVDRLSPRVVLKRFLQDYL